MPASTTTALAIEQDAILANEGGLLMFVDEAGDERMSEPNHALFGLGGCRHRSRPRRAVLPATGV